MKVIVGLGNPGKRYALTRHNIGFLVLDEISKKHSIPIEKSIMGALFGKGKIGEETLILLKPQIFMNRSGEAVSKVLRYFRLEPEELLVVYDDVDLDFGRIRLRPAGSAGGHKGLGSIISFCGTDEIPRLRIGIGRPPESVPMPMYVLTGFTNKEKEKLPQIFEKSLTAVEVFLREGMQQAMNIANVNNNFEMD